MRLFFMRHGEADHNRRLLVNESNRHVSNLTEDGRREALESALELSERIRFDVIYCSPLKRCRQTAEIVREKQPDPKPPIKVNRRLSEFRTGFDNRLAVIWFVRLLLAKNRVTKKFKGGQSIAEAAGEVEKFWEEIYAEHLDGNVLIVAHLITFQMLCHLLYNTELRVPWRPTLYLDTGSWHEFVPKSRK